MTGKLLSPHSVLPDAGTMPIEHRPALLYDRVNRVSLLGRARMPGIVGVAAGA
jgi:hypothetical protein